MTKIALISATGTGRKRTLPALRDSTLCKVVAIHGRDSQSLAILAEEFDVEHTYTDLELLIQERHFDIAMICSPPFLHEDQARILLDAGIPTFVEKPLALTAGGTRRLMEHAGASDTPLGIAHHLRHTDIYRAIRDCLDSGRLGAIDTATFEWSFAMNREAPSAKWKLDPTLNGPTTFSDAGIHCIDVGVGLFGPGQVVAASGSVPQPPIVTWESCDALALHGSTRVLYRASRLHGPFSNQLLISGTKGELIAPGFFGEKPASKLHIQTSQGNETLTFEERNPYQAEVEDFATFVSKPESPRLGTSPEEALAAAEMLDEISRLIS